MSGNIKITGARIHNLKSVDVEIPRGKLTVITGVSGSGKSSLAFDTLYEEGKRRYLMFSDTSFTVDERASSFESITGLSPTVAVEQRVVRQSNPRSTVGTRTKIDGMLAVLMARDGERPPGYPNTPLDMAMFQKNSPKGMCVKCLGAGIVKTLDEDTLFGDLSQRVDDVVLGVGKRGTTRRMTDAFYKRYGISREKRLSELTEEQLELLKYGDGGKSEFRGFIPWVMFITQGGLSSSGRLEYLLTKAGYMRRVPCPRCNGTGLGDTAAKVTLGGKNIVQLEEMYIKDLIEFLKTVKTGEPSRLVSEIIAKLECMADVGLHHLSLSRPVPSLSGGEIQRLFLASYIIAEMDSIIFIFDEPTIGLHELEKAKLLEIIRRLADRGNTVVAVEHDVNFMRAADYIVDLGPYAGENGGERIFQGTFTDFTACEKSVTAPYLSGAKKLPVKNIFKPVNREKILRIENAGIHNLKNISADIPLGLLVGVAGVSGSGKSSLITDSLVPKLKESLKNKLVYEKGSLFDESEVGNGDEAQIEQSGEPFAANDSLSLSGIGHIKKCVVVDQKPIGRTRTSCPATYTGVFDKVRALFARESGREPGLFTVNSKGGCPTCKGNGVISYHVGMGNFIHTECDDCGGTGFSEEARSVRVDGVSINEILDMSVSRAVEFFRDKDKSVIKMLQTLERVGMGYIKLGQKTPTISGGEAQRIKLAAELGKTGAVKDYVYILDEPTTGLSFSDTAQLLKLMRELTEKGATVIVTEHDPSVLSYCDYLIELGPGGGSDGGLVIAAGTPAELRVNKHSVIGKYLPLSF